jgi:hypothetical protein
MPVHTRRDDGILRLVLDGDFTLEEVERVGTQGLEAAEEEPLALLVDASGAVALDRRDPRELDDLTAFLGRQGSRVRAVAILAPGDPAYDLMHAVALRVRGHGVAAAAFRTRAEAEAWVKP